MFFVLSKIFWTLAEPGNFLLLLALVGLILTCTWWKDTGRRLVAAAILLMAIAFLTPLPTLVMRPLEDRFPNPNLHEIHPTGIIVLGGALDPWRAQTRGVPVLAASGSRLTSGVTLSRMFPEAKLIFTGGNGTLNRNVPVESTTVRQLWLDLGVPPERMEFEEESRNTWENAVFTRDLVKPKPGEVYLLVTSAVHMPRSVGIFRKVGFDVIPYNADYRTFGNDLDWTTYATVQERMQTLDSSIREWIGLVVYYLTGKTTALFPAP
ncbi:YdcF family protein [Beijerinckia mobilis]|uniref:YdcF family protein n=1 Tax=Beijerinckia mobilis TaxID=231434 RepID=UPI0005565C11|nr:YdcF family protein [Beijerinckia mobilis]